MNDSNELRLAEAINRHAQATERMVRVLEDHSRMLEVFIEAMPATKEAQILGVSERTIRRRRKMRQAARLLVTTF